MKNMDQFIEIDFITVTQPIGSFYIGCIDWRKLIEISEADIREIKKEDKTEGNFDSYLGIQRKRSASRIKEIAEYVKTIDASFPTSIILYIETTYETINGVRITELDQDYVDKNLDKVEVVVNLEVNNEDKKLRIRKDEKVAKILDGQHRIEGLKEAMVKFGFDDRFDLNVTIFPDADIDDQAQIFSVINKAQTKVNKSLVYDLYDYAKFQSPQKTAHDIVRLLNKREDSPFYKKIKILGTAENKDTETIAQATFVELILKYISKNPMYDRDELKKQSLFNQRPLKKIESLEEKRKLIFRNLFIDKQDEKILRTIWNYFAVVQEKWPIAWNDTQIQGNILNRSTGVIALMRFLRYIVNDINDYENSIPKDTFRPYFDQINLQDLGFTSKEYLPGSSGQSKLLNRLLEFCGL
jgi:DGQHR domain-containing protein